MPREDRALFDAEAELYDRARQGYPARLFDDLVELAGLADGARVLEVGCGTGQATRPMAERGYRIVAVELGPALAAVARRNLAKYPNVEVQTAAFESWPLPSEPFDLVMAATMWHWLDAASALRKAADALRPRGALAVFGYEHVAGGDEQFFIDVQECYEQHMPGTPPGLRLTASDDIPAPTAAIEPSDLFGPAAHRRYTWERVYTTASYLDVLQTYSNHLALQPDQRVALFSCVRELLDSRYGGRIRKAYMCDLVVAKKGAEGGG